MTRFSIVGHWVLVVGVSLVITRSAIGDEPVEQLPQLRQQLPEQMPQQVELQPSWQIKLEGQQVKVEELLIDAIVPPASPLELEAQDADTRRVREVITRLAMGLQTGVGDNLIAEVWDAEQGVVEDPWAEPQTGPISYDLNGGVRLNDWMRQHVSRELAENWSRGQLRVSSSGDDLVAVGLPADENFATIAVYFRQQGDGLRIVRISKSHNLS